METVDGWALRRCLMRLIDEVLDDEASDSPCAALHAVQAYIAVGARFGLWTAGDTELVMGLLREVYGESSDS